MQLSLGQKIRELRKRDGRTQENLAGMRVVKAFAREPYEFEQFEKDNQKLLSCHLFYDR